MLKLADLQIAWQAVRRRGKAAGIDKIPPDLFQAIAHEQLPILLNELRSDTYIPQPAYGFYVHRQQKPKRLVSIATVRDRIVQRYLLRELTPSLEHIAYHHSYAYRPGCSAPMAVEHFMLIHPQQQAWILKIDIHEFFDQLCWPLLFHRLERLELSPQLISWVKLAVMKPLVLNYHCLPRTMGVLQGCILSGALANLYLNPFDRWCDEARLRIVRYGDDMAVACRSEAETLASLAQLTDWLHKLHLSLSPSKTMIIPPGQEYLFLGHRIQGQQILGTLKDWHPYRSHQANKSRNNSPVNRRAPQCSLIADSPYSIEVPTQHYWRQPMTTLYITDQGAKLTLKNKQFYVYCQDKLKLQVPVNQVTHIILFGCCHVTHGATCQAFYKNIPIIYLSTRGRYYGRLEAAGLAEVNYLIDQVNRHQDLGFKQNIARTLVLAKLHNCRLLLQRRQRKSPHELTREAIVMLAKLMDSIPEDASVESLLGYEGQGAKVYYRGLAQSVPEPFQFLERSIRPPKDPVNSLLSLGYTLLHFNLYSFVTAAGLHTHFGHLHTTKKHHPALVMDLTEEFRALVVDSFVLYLLNSKILTVEDFTPPDEKGGVYLLPDALKTFLKHWERQLLTEVTHPHTGNVVPYRRCMELQVWEYIACITGKQDKYRPMTWKQ